MPPTIVPLVLLLFLLNVNAIRRLPGQVHKTANSTSFRSLTKSAVGVPIPESREDHLVTSLPFLKNDDFSTAHYAGLLPANAKKTKYFFYWLFDHDSDNSLDNESDIPLLIWMNGGPGCSSMDGMSLCSLMSRTSLYLMLTLTFVAPILVHDRFISRAWSIPTHNNVSKHLEYEDSRQILAQGTCLCCLCRPARGHGSLLYNGRRLSYQ